jgi:exopolysaccharide production protein ExoZ
MAFLLLALPQLFNTATFDLRGLILSYLFIPYTPSSANQAPVLSVGWTLSYEMYFYLLVALGLFLSRKQFLIALGCFFAASTLLPWPVSGPIAATITNSLLLEFYAGFLIGTAYKSGMKLPTWVSCAFLACGAALFYAWIAGTITTARALSWGLPSVLLVAGSVFLERSASVNFPRWLMALGDSSYSLYLSHFLLLPVVFKAAAMLEIVQSIPPDGFIVLGSICCCVGGYSSYRLLEVPLLRYLSNARQRNFSAVPATE